MPEEHLETEVEIKEPRKEKGLRSDERGMWHGTGTRKHRAAWSCVSPYGQPWALQGGPLALSVCGPSSCPVRSLLLTCLTGDNAEVRRSRGARRPGPDPWWPNVL